MDSNGYHKDNTILFKCWNLMSNCITFTEMDSPQYSLQCSLCRTWYSSRIVQPDIKFKSISFYTSPSIDENIHKYTGKCTYKDVFPNFHSGKYKFLNWIKECSQMTKTLKVSPMVHLPFFEQQRQCTQTNDVCCVHMVVIMGISMVMHTNVRASVLCLQAIFEASVVNSTHFTWSLLPAERYMDLHQQLYTYKLQ